MKRIIEHDGSLWVYKGEHDIVVEDNAALRAEMAEERRQHALDFRCGKCGRVWHALTGIEECPFCRATRAEAELAEFKAEANRTFERIRRHAAYQHKRAVDKIDDCMQAEAERDEARGRCERLREVAKAATDRLVCDASCPARITGAEVDCTCGLVAVYDALDAALAECGE